MLTFDYKAKNTKTGQIVKAKVQADDQQTAARLIREQNLVPIEIKGEKNGGARKFSRIPTKDKVLLSRQLATLINAGLPLVQSLRQVAMQTINKPLKAILNGIIADVESGKSFSSALAKHPKVFNRVYVSLVAASETSGTLDEGLERLANQQEKDADIISKVRGALIYPMVVLFVMLGVVLFMIIKVLPEVQTIYAGLPNSHLPILTVVLLDISHFVTHFYFVVIIVLILLVVFGRRWSKTASGRSVIDKLKMKVWPTSPLFMKMYMARFARTGTTLIGSGVPIIQVLEITGEAVDNVHIKASLKKAIEKVKGGTALSDTLAGDPNFLELVPNMLHIGEQSGAMETMMEKVAEYYEKQVDEEIKAVSTIIEPVMMIIMGVIAIVIVAAILLPIYGLVNNASFTNGG
jgi:type IV pilus assembly protein PilC